MKDEFKLKNVTIVIDQTPTERQRGKYYLRATNMNSPLEILGTSGEVSEIFSQWLYNTMNAMGRNNCSKIKMELTWE